MKMHVLAAAAAVSVLSISGQTNAAAVTYEVAGGFGGPDSLGAALAFINPANPSAAPDTFATFAGTALVYDTPGTYTNVPFGTFSVTNTGTAGVRTLDNDTNAFVIVFSQTIPAGGADDLASQFLGGLITSSGGFASILFSPTENSTTIGDATFSLNGEYVVPINASGNGSLAITGTVVVVPEPVSIAAVGAAGLGLVRRRRNG